MEQLASVLDFIFGCHHSHLSRVFTMDRRTYKVCVDCGAKFQYSLSKMRVEHRLPSADGNGLDVGKFAYSEGA